VKIVLLGHDDVASLFALDRLVRLLPEHEYTAFLSGELTPPAAPVPGLAELAAMDARLCSELRAAGLAPALAAARALPAPNSADGLATLRAVAPDVIVSIRYRRILRDAAIAVPRHGVLNLHSGILPDYKGVMATFWAMLHREAQIGATLHRIVDSGIDTGPVLGVCKLAARYDRSYLWNVLALYAPGCDMIVAALQQLDAGAAPNAEAQRPGGTYFSTPAAADVERFLAAGLDLADGGELERYATARSAAPSTRVEGT